MWTAESLEATRLVRAARLRLRAQRTPLTAAFEPLPRRRLVEPAVDPADLPRRARLGRRAYRSRVLKPKETKPGAPPAGLALGAADPPRAHEAGPRRRVEG